MNIIGFAVNAMCTTDVNCILSDYWLYGWFQVIIWEFYDGTLLQKHARYRRYIDFFHWFPDRHCRMDTSTINNDWDIDEP